MKTLHSLYCTLFSLIALLLSTSCVNQIAEDDTENNLTPITLTSSINLMQTKATETAFENNDAIGLYVLLDAEKLDGERHANNTKFTFNNGNLTPESTIYYSEGETKHNFISYYPYKKKAIANGATTMEIITKTGQSDPKAFSASDFLVATANEVSSSKDPVNLKFMHKLYRINIILKAAEGYTTDELLNANPSVKIAGVYTKASYDFETGDFNNHSTTGDIIPNGNWKIENGKLTGKTAIIIPQELKANHCIIELEINNKTFECTLDDAHNFDRGKVEDFELTIKERVTAAINPSIEGWGTPDKKEVDANETVAAPVINISDLTFAKSPTYKIMSEGIQVAELCKEYLSTKDFSAQAIVIYPMKDKSVDLQNGLVLKVIGESTKKHGGNAVWNTSNNTLTYTAGNKDVIENIYISQEHEILTTRPNNTLQIEAKENLLVDIRGTEIVNYPIVKIGTQYWIGSDLEATRYTNGKEIACGESFEETSAKYCTPDGENIFYNAEAVKSDFIAPQGWRISNAADWNTLNTYIGKKACLIKAGSEWGQIESNAPNNLTGLNIQVKGLYNNIFKEDKYALYWQLETEPEKAIKTTIALSDKNNLINLNEFKNNLLGASIRCVKE